MDSNRLIEFRQALYACFLRAGDALMNTTDALLTEMSAQSLVELSLSPFFERRWPSLYAAFQDGVIDRDALQQLFVRFAPAVGPDHRLLIGADASSISRPHSATARDRTYVHQSNLPEGSKPVVPGWQFSTLSVLPDNPSSWTYVLDNRRIASHQTQGAVAAQQLQDVIPLLPVRPLFVADGYYGSVAFLLLTESLACDKLVRFAKNRVLYRPAPPLTGKRGAPRKDGAPFKCHDPATHGQPDACWSGQDPNGHTVDVACWHALHFKPARHLRVSVLRVTRHGATNTTRDPTVSWFLFHGQTLPPLAEIPTLYARRYSVEHAYRVDKQDLLWAAVRVRTPDQFQRWTDIVASVRNQLHLCRHLAVAWQPWERKHRAATPQQVRRGMGRILAQLGTPARPPQVRGKSPGRQVGQTVKRALRFPVVYKATPKAKQIV